MEPKEDRIMHKDPTEFRKRFAAWKLGKPVYNKGRILPSYTIGEDVVKLQIPRLDRVYGITPDNETVKDNNGKYIIKTKGLKEYPLLEYNRDFINRYEIRSTTPEKETLRSALNDNVYFDAGVLPEVFIYPPKDNAVNKINEILPKKDLRMAFYDDLESEAEMDDTGDFDSRMYINRLYDLYKKSSRPTIKSTSSKLNIIVPLYQKIIGRDADRANYDPFTNTMFVSPESIVYDIEAELSHAYLFHGTDTPRSLNWVKLYFTLPGDIKINRRNGYDRIGNKEFVAHSIIEPIFRDYLFNKNTTYEDVYNSIQDVYNDQKLFFSPIDSGPFKGNLIPKKPLTPPTIEK